MAETTLNTRLKLNTKTTAQWALVPTFVPLKGEIVVYSDYASKTVSGETTNIPGVKIGDGNAYVADLPFVSSGIAESLITHTSDTTIHTNSTEKGFWNNKVSLSASGEELVFSIN